MAIPVQLHTLGSVTEGAALKDYSTFKIGGPARYFFVAKTADDMCRALDAAVLAKLPVFVLGGRITSLNRSMCAALGHPRSQPRAVGARGTRGRVALLHALRYRTRRAATLPESYESQVGQLSRITYINRSMCAGPSVLAKISRF